MAMVDSRLQLATQSQFFNDVLPDIVKYVEYWKKHWARWGVEIIVATFYNAHGVAPP